MHKAFVFFTVFRLLSASNLYMEKAKLVYLRKIKDQKGKD